MPSLPLPTRFSRSSLRSSFPPLIFLEGIGRPLFAQMESSEEMVLSSDALSCACDVDCSRCHCRGAAAEHRSPAPEPEALHSSSLMSSTTPPLHETDSLMDSSPGLALEGRARLSQMESAEETDEPLPSSASKRRSSSVWVDSRGVTMPMRSGGDAAVRAAPPSSSLESMVMISIDCCPRCWLLGCARSVSLCLPANAASLYPLLPLYCYYHCHRIRVRESLHA